MTTGERFAEAFASKDASAVRELLAPDVDFMALTPRRHWQAEGPDQVLEILFGSWLEEGDKVDSLVSVEVGPDVEDTHHVSYRLALSTPNGPRTMEQQAYYREDDGRLAFMRVVCSGFRPVS
ncbi:MAG TPA: nuclear transport factor 2 family protein [Nocardioidaceae bacterium]|nr:nuclear transport factor 2 family protein [Nocardioidaceae bacterium]